MSDTEEKTEETKKTVKAKTVSLISKIIGIIVILGGFVLKSCGVWECETNDLIKVGFSIMGICSTVDINLMIEKFTAPQEPKA